MKQHNKVLIGLGAGTLAGIGGHAVASPAVLGIFNWMSIFGQLFIRSISMIVIPLVVASMVVGITSLGDLRKLGRIGGKTLAFFFLTTLLAASVSVPLALLIKPGSGLALSSGAAAPATPATPASATQFPEVILSIIPANPFAAAAGGDLLGVIVFTLIFGAAIGSLPPERRVLLVGFFQAINDASMLVIQWIMKLAPAAVFCLIASVVVRFGLDLLRGLALFCAVVVAGLLLQVLLVYGLLLAFACRRNPWHFYRSISKVALVAFSTSSSSATLPLSIETAEQQLGIPLSVAAFTLPLGTTMNKNGSALYKSAAVIFIAQAVGLKLGFSLLMRIVFAATLSAMTTAGVPGSGLVSIVVVLQASGLGALAPFGSVLVAGVDRILDMMRTTVNAIGNLVSAAWIAQSETPYGMQPAAIEEVFVISEISRKG
jgi:proton glutamate symport protein